MRKSFVKTLSFSFISITSLSIISCNNETFVTSKPYIVFNLEGSEFVVKEENNVFNIVDTNLENKRFIGWYTTSNPDTILFKTATTINHDEFEQYSLDGKSLYLNAYFANVATITFNSDNSKVESLDSIQNNTITVPYLSKEGNTFLGWSLNSNGGSIDLHPKDKISYSDISSLLKSNMNLNYYPVFKERINNLHPYAYNIADNMAEIHINTENGLAIDDKSLIIPDEHKGKNGELAVYDYVNATISATNCEEKYAFENVNGKVKVRGNYTSTYDKKPIRIKFNKKQNLLGLNNDSTFKNWVLLAGWKDSSLLRDAVAYYLGNSLLKNDGYYSSSFRFVKVYLNQQYNGVYLLGEQQEIGANRINIQESKNENDSEKTGYFLEFDGYYKNEPENQRFTISYDDVKTGNNGFTISNDIMNTAQYDFIKKAINNIWKVIYDACKNPHKDISKQPFHTIDNNGDYIISDAKTAEEAVDSVLDTESLIDMYLIHEICQDRDIGWSSFYFSIDFSENGNKKLTFNSPWDFDYAMGNNTFGNAMKVNYKDTNKMINEGRMTRKNWNQYSLTKTAELSEEDFTFSNVNSLYCNGTDNPWFLVFSNQQWLWNRLLDKWFDAKNANVFSNMIEMVENISNKYENEFNENYSKWPKSMGLKLDAYQPEIVSSFVSHKQASQYLKIWLSKRIDGLEEALKSKVF